VLRGTVGPVQEAGFYRIEAETEVVQLWSSVPMPLGVKDWTRRMRDELQAALSRLTPSPTGRLHAVYAGPVSLPPLDAENPLFYNVGGKHLSTLMSRGVTFERWHDAPPAPEGTGEAMALTHYQRYTPVKAAGFVGWRQSELLASFADVPVRTFAKPAPIWVALRQHSDPPQQLGDLRPFVARVTITDTQRVYPLRSVAGSIKTLVDGVVSAYHAHNADGRAEAERLAAKGFGSPEWLQAMLRDPAWALLGARRLLWLTANDVQWNPGDDQCVAAEINLQHRPELDGASPHRYRIDGELWVAEPVTAPRLPVRHSAA
jgi:hypothetical protein